MHPTRNNQRKANIRQTQEFIWEPTSSEEWSSGGGELEITLEGMVLHNPLNNVKGELLFLNIHLHILVLQP